MHRALPTTAAVLLLLCLPVIIDGGAVSQAASLWRLAQGPHPYFLPDHALLLYVRVPMVTVSACVLLLSPGLLLVQAFRAADNAGDWVLRSLAVSVVVLSVATTALQGAIGRPVVGGVFVGLVLALMVLVVVGALLMGRAGCDVPLGVNGAAILTSLLVVPFLLEAALAPKLLWESFNGDGSHAFEATRLLLRSASPFFPPDVGPIHTYPGVKTFLPSYVMSWFVRIFGENEPGLRFTYFLMLSGVYAGVAALVHKAKETWRTDAWLVWMGLIVFTIVMGYSAAYTTYHADFALPGVADAFTIAMALGMIGASVQRRPGWLALFCVLIYATSPAGVILAAFWIVAMLLTMRPFRINEAAIITSVIVVCVLIERITPDLMSAIGLAGPGSEHSAGALARRISEVQWRDWRRVVSAVVPSGILPAMALLAWRRQDDLSRAVTLLSLAVFGFFYMQSRFALHYFAPIMVLPLVVLWRTMPPRALALRVGAVALAFVALLLSLPPATHLWTATRQVGESIAYRGNDYALGAPAAFMRNRLLNELFRRQLSADGQLRRHGVTMALSYYSQHRDTTRFPSYVLQPAQLTPPLGGSLVAKNRTGALFVMNSTALAHDTSVLSRTSGIAPIYRLPRRTLFGR